MTIRIHHANGTITEIRTPPGFQRVKASLSEEVIARAREQARQLNEALDRIEKGLGKPKTHWPFGR